MFEMSEALNEVNIVERIRRSTSALSVKQLALMLGFTSSNIQKQAKRGKIPSYRIGGAVRFDPVCTADWLQSKAMA
jgi:excisionase family DNA binding protein